MIPSTLYNFFNAKNIPNSEVDRQYSFLLNGAKYSNILKPAVIKDGITLLSLEEVESLSELYKKSIQNLRVLKFVPASGAATRMFKDLVNFEADNKPNPQVEQLINSIEKLAFYDLIPKNLNRDEAVKYIISTLHYNATAKGLIPFHQYDSKKKTAFEEHWKEAALYASSNIADLHFTVSEQHQAAFQHIESKNIKAFESEHLVRLNITYSNQLSSTDTLCIDSDDNIVLATTGEPILRPGGHGALIQNLQNIKADLVFIKNIDNVVHQNHMEATVLYKQALAGKLIELKTSIFNELKAIDNGSANPESLEQLAEEACILTPQLYNSWDNEIKINFWKRKFNRPIRVCGMVKNEGEPGGGPFWVEASDGVSLQIVESAQIDLDNDNQKSILHQSTHFNPVDLVCYLTNYQGNKFNLLDFVDEATAFVATKTVEGKEVKVLERPGLWNGAMADWITLFVEVPMETFNPVKTVNDLLKPMHIY